MDGLPHSIMDSGGTTNLERILAPPPGKGSIGGANLARSRRVLARKFAFI
jgi:hypothetical protein